MCFFALLFVGIDTSCADELQTTASPASDPSILEAQRYEHGEGVAKDPQKAAELYCLSARSGNTEASYRLGWMYANGRGLPRDDAFAAALFRRAADHGHVYATRMLDHLHPTDAHLPACMTPPPLAVAEADVEAPLPEAWLKDKNRIKIVEMARLLAPQFNVDPRLALAVIVAESGFEVNAVSPKNAQGLMQLIPETAERFQVKQIRDPVQNMRGGLAYLRWLLAYFQGDVPLVLAAYNAGEGAVERYRGVPPYSETRQYVARIAKFYGSLTHRYDASVVDPSPLMSALKARVARVASLRD